MPDNLPESPLTRLLCISYFDEIIGPNLFYCNEVLTGASNLPDLGRILEFQTEVGTFIFAFRKYQTLNHIFYIDSEFARGGQVVLMISYIFKASYFKNEIVDVFKYLESKKSVLEEYASELKKLRELPSLIKKIKGKKKLGNPLELSSNDFRNEFLQLNKKYFKKLSPTFQIQIPHSSKKIFIFGKSSAGKTAFLKNIEAIQFYNQTNPDLPTLIYELVIDNIEIMTYDSIERDFECETCINLGDCLHQAQAFILMINIAEKNSIAELKEMFQTIVNRCEELGNFTTPILIIGNKINNKEVINSKDIYTTFNLKELKDCGMKLKYFPINIVKEDQKIMKALRWLIHHMI